MIFDSPTTPYGLDQIISDPTPILANSSFCINLIFIFDNWQWSHPTSHRNITFTIKLSWQTQYQSKVFHILFKRLFWDYENAGIPSINPVISIFEWVINWS